MITIILIEHGLRSFQHFISPPSSRRVLTSKDPQETSTSARGLRPTGKPRLSRSPGRFHRLGSLCAGRAPDGERGPETQTFPLPTCHLRLARGAPSPPPSAPGSQTPTSSPGPEPHPASGSFPQAPPGAEDCGSCSPLCLGKEIGIAEATSAGNTQIPGKCAKFAISNSGGCSLFFTPGLNPDDLRSEKLSSERTLKILGSSCKRHHLSKSSYTFPKGIVNRGASTICCLLTHLRVLTMATDYF